MNWTPVFWFVGAMLIAGLAGYLFTRHPVAAVLLLAAGLILFSCAGCASIGSIGLRGSYENEQGQTFSGGVDIGLRDAKTIKPLHQ